MFKELSPILAQRNLHIQASMDNDQVTLIVQPVVSSDEAKAGKSALNTPLSLKGTVEELDSELPRILSDYANRHASLAASLETSLLLMEAADKEAAQKAAKKIQETNKASAQKPAQSSPQTDETDEIDVSDLGCCSSPAAEAKAVMPKPAKPAVQPTSEADLWG